MTPAANRDHLTRPYEQEIRHGDAEAHEHAARHDPSRAGGRLIAGVLAPFDDLQVVPVGVGEGAELAISRIAACDTDAVRDATSANRLYLPTRLLPEHYDIPCPYAPASTALAAELLGCYDTAATATRSAAVALDKLAVTTGSPSSTLAVARLSAGRR